MAKIEKWELVEVDRLVPYENNAKVHNESQINKICDSIREFGFVSPCIIDKDLNIIAGHGRVMAAKKMGMKTVPCVFVEGLSDAQRRAYILADNKLTELGGWDDFLVQQELERLKAEDFNVELTGFELDEDDVEVDDDFEEDAFEGEPVPDSKVFIYAASVFTGETEKIITAKIPKETAEHVLAAASAVPIDQLVMKLTEALNDL